MAKWPSASARGPPATCLGDDAHPFGMPFDPSRRPPVWHGRLGPVFRIRRGESAAAPPRLAATSPSRPWAPCPGLRNGQVAGLADRCDLVRRPALRQRCDCGRSVLRPGRPPPAAATARTPATPRRRRDARCRDLCICIGPRPAQETSQTRGWRLTGLWCAARRRRRAHGCWGAVGKPLYYAAIRPMSASMHAVDVVL